MGWKKGLVWAKVMVKELLENHCKSYSEEAQTRLWLFHFLLC